MIEIKALVKTKHNTKLREGEKYITQLELLQKVYLKALESLTSIVPEFTHVTFIASQDTRSSQRLSNKLIWRECGDVIRLFDMDASEISAKEEIVWASFFLFEPKSSASEKILINLN